LSLHPLVDLSIDKEVKKAAGFRAAATELKGEGLNGLYETEFANAPDRADAGKKYFVAYNSRLAAQRKPGRDDEHFALVLAEYCRRDGARLALPEDGGEIEFVYAQIPLKSAAEDKSQGDADLNKGVGRIDLLGVGPDDRMVIAQAKFLAPSAARGRTGDTPLRALIEGLANAAVAKANVEPLRKEIQEKAGREIVDEPPILMLLGSSRYWELCRKREAQKGAAWIKELERLAREIEEHIGVTVLFLGCELEGDPGWSYGESGPALDGTPRLTRAWEHGAGKVRPKPRPRPKQIDPADIPVDADLSRPVRSYAISDSFQSGDRIQHPTLGLGIVQGIAGNGKISVLFGEKRSLLVHERGAPAAATP